MWYALTIQTSVLCYDINETTHCDCFSIDWWFCNNTIRTEFVESKCSHDPGPSPCLYCTRCAVSYCLWHLLSVKNIWFQYPLLEVERERESWLGVERGRGVEFGLPNRNFCQFRFSPLSFLKGLCHVFVFTTNLCLPKSIFHTPCLRRNHTSALLWNESSYRPWLTGKLCSPQLSLLSATVVEAVDRSRDRQTYVPSEYRRGGTACFQRGHYHSSVSPPHADVCLLLVPAGTVTVSPLKPAFSAAHTHMSAVLEYKF